MGGSASTGAAEYQQFWGWAAQPAPQQCWHPNARLATRQGTHLLAGLAGDRQVVVDAGVAPPGLLTADRWRGERIRACHGRSLPPSTVLSQPGAPTSLLTWGASMGRCSTRAASSWDTAGLQSGAFDVGVAQQCVSFGRWTSSGEPRGSRNRSGTYSCMQTCGQRARQGSNERGQYSGRNARGGKADFPFLGDCPAVRNHASRPTYILNSSDVNSSSPAAPVVALLGWRTLEAELVRESAPNCSSGM